MAQTVHDGAFVAGRAARLPTAAAHLMLAATACMVGPLLPAAGSRTAWSASETVAGVRWAAEPVVPIAGAPSPAVTHPAQCAGDQPPVRISSAAREITCNTVRRAARTRLGGRFGP